MAFFVVLTDNTISSKLELIGNFYHDFFNSAGENTKESAIIF